MAAAAEQLAMPDRHRWRSRCVGRGLGLFWAMAVASQIHSADQPQWGEGWSRNLVSGERGLPESFDPMTGKHIKWTAELGTETHGTPIIAGGRVYIGTNNGHPRDPDQQGDRGVLMCFDEQTGRFLWQLAVPKRTEDIYLDWPHSGICSPVTVEGDRVYVVNNRGVVMCLEKAKGQRLKGKVDAPAGSNRAGRAVLSAPGASLDERRGQVGREGEDTAPYRLGPGECDVAVVWQFDLTSGAGIWSHDAAHSSILIDGDDLYLNTGTGVDNTHKRIRTPEAPSLVVLDKRTGELVARENEHLAPNIFHSTWSAPSLAEVNGRRLVFFAAGNGMVYAFEAIRNGVRELWSNGVMGSGSDGVMGKDQTGLASGASLFQHSSTRALHTPVVLKTVWQFDFDPAAPKTDVHQYKGNRREGPSNFYGMPVFDQGRIYVAGGGDIWWGKNEAWLKCIDATQTGDITTNGLVWSYRLQRHVLATPAVRKGLVFIADCGGMFHCVDAKTGRACWTQELNGEAWASPLVADDKVYLGTRRGVFYVFAADREKRVLSTIEVGSPISSTATVANGVLYVTTMSRLYAVQERAR